MRHSALIAAACAGISPGLCSMSTESAKAHDTGGGSRKHGNQNNDEAASRHANLGLDAQGTMRIGDRYSIGVKGDKIQLTQGRSGRQVEVSESELAGLLEKTYFVDQHGDD